MDSSRVRTFAVAGVAGIAGLLFAGTVSEAQKSGGGHYTAAQARSGAAVYSQTCSQCHGVNLQGGAGPALVGSAFQKYVGKSGTAASLYDFISKQMPADKPGSLTQQQYLDVTAYILQRNGYPAGDVPLVMRTLSQVALGGGTVSPKGPANNNEIVRAAPPQNTVYSKLPAGADVNVTDAMLASADGSGANWLLHGRTYDNARYSPLTQIDASNIGSLQLVGIAQTGMTASFETTPIVVNGVMYVTTPTVANKMKVMALDATNGRPIWDSVYSLGSFQICCGPVNRGAAVAYGMVYVLTLDDKLLALDATTGKSRWTSTVADPNVGYSETMTPQVYDGLVIIGSAGGEWPIRGFVAAYDAKTGKKRWQWDSTDPKTYAGDSWKRGGAMVWTTPALDRSLGLVIFSTGNPNPDLNGTVRKGDNKWSDSIVALDVHTGKFKWGYQQIKHDVWDYDAVSPVVLFDVHQNGQTIPAAGEAGKVGWFYILDRRNGKLIKRSDPYVAMSKNMFSQPTAKGVVMLPGANGGAEWSPAAYSPQTHYVYVLAMDQLMKFATHTDPYQPGRIRLGSAFSNVEPHGVQDGRFVAIDTETGKIAWTVMTPQPLIGGALATAGNLAFYGEGNGWFNAVDAKTGKRVWRFNLGAGVNAPPVSYEVNGQQYIAVAAGGNFQLTFPYGDTIAIFKLGGAAPAPQPTR
ncbi:MAG TPA: PQQ-binding-like beta-propeller repeat protein [Candidatus Elarobacter sp.]|jgi:PQQ-dependent dehydrogenase (methanol/ethanol family)|nr:PQQ-binding-like beta-propeller repeat protein [Candidatus Elarobacter sp.]